MSPWLINGKDINLFRPFWKNDADDYALNQTWMSDDPPTMDNIYDRFVLMFGKDASKGTMSALVTLKCLPNEIFGENMEQFYKDVYGKEFKIEKIPFKNDKNNKKIPDETNTLWTENRNKRRLARAALTITIFMRMLDEELWQKKGIQKDIKKEYYNKVDAFDGYLYHYLTQAPAAYYGEITAKTTDDGEKLPNLFLFAHGGITDDFLKWDGDDKTNKNIIREMDIIGWDELLKNTRTTTKKGGGQREVLITKIIKYNLYCKILLKNFFTNKETGLWKDPMLSLLDLSAGPKKQNPNQVKQPTDQVLDSYYPGNGKIFNVFGHASSSCGYSFGKSRDKDNKVMGERTYFINTDFSSTLFKSFIKCDKKYDENYLIMILDNKNPEETISLTCDGKIYTTFTYKDIATTENYYNTIEQIHTAWTVISEDKKKKGIYINKNKNPPTELTKEEATTLNKIEQEKLIGPSDIETSLTEGIVFDKSQNLFSVINDIDSKNETKNFFFNGIAVKNEKKYAVFSSIYSKDYKTSMAIIPYEKPAEGEAAPAEIAEIAGAEGGRRRKRKTRKHRRTHKKQKGGKKRTKKRSGRKTRRRHKA